METFGYDFTMNLNVKRESVIIDKSENLIKNDLLESFGYNFTN